MPIHAVHHFNIRAPLAEILALRDFYCNVIGLTLGPRPPFRSAGFWLYAEGAAILHLSVAGDTEFLPDLPERKSALDHVALQCSNLQAIVDKLQKHGVNYELTTVPATNQTQIFLEDP